MEEVDREPSTGGASLGIEHEKIARRAYELFLARGAEHGSALQDWLDAERELTAPTSRSPKKPRKR